MTAVEFLSARAKPTIALMRHRLAAVTLVMCCTAATAHAHGDVHVQIQAVSREIAAAPSAALYLKRAELYHAHEEYPLALADYDDAEKLNPALAAIRYARGRTFFHAGMFAPARAQLDAYLEKNSTHAEAFLLRARVLVALKRYPEAVRDFDRNLALLPHPLPECFLERAAALTAAGQKPAALAGLDEALRRCGNLVTLQQAAIALELELGRPEAALARIDRVLADLPRKESWLVRRGEILERAGRPAEARHTFAEALALIDQLPARHRETKAMRDLQERLRLKLGS